MWLESFLSMPISGGFPIEKLDKFSEHEFRGRRWMWVDPMKDMAAAVIARDHGWKTSTQIASDMGTDFDDNVEEIKRETSTVAGTILETQKQQGNPAERAVRLMESIAKIEGANDENTKQE
jgi:capsid protein